MGTHEALSGTDPVRGGASERGFTLVELLIAVAILGMVVGIASYGYSLFARGWSGRLGQFEQAQAQYQRLDLVVQALENTLPYVVRDDRGNPGFYFLGRDEGLTLVTMTPVFSPGQIAVIRVFRESAGGGRWNLVYEEAPLEGTGLRLANQQLPFRHRMIVLHDVPRAEFAYYGWPSPEERAIAADQPELDIRPQWYDTYDGLVRRQHPQRIALQLGSERAVVFVPERADAAFRRYVSTE